LQPIQVFGALIWCDVIEPDRWDSRHLVIAGHHRFKGVKSKSPKTPQPQSHPMIRSTRLSCPALGQFTAAHQRGARIYRI